MTDFTSDQRSLFGLCTAFLASPTGYAAMPAPVQAMFMAEMPGPGKNWAESWINVGELVFANRADLNAEALRLGAQCTNMCRLNGFSTLGGDRGWAVQQALQRDAGDDPPPGGGWPDPGDDPDPFEAWIPPSE